MLLGEEPIAQILASRLPSADRVLGTIFVSHDLTVVRHVSDRISVMYLGSTMEVGPADEIHDRPVHPYTEALISSSPQEATAARRERILLQGDIPSPVNPPSGCVFRTRCALAQDLCAEERPPLRVFGDSHLAACHFPLRAAAVTVETLPRAGTRRSIPEMKEDV